MRVNNIVTEARAFVTDSVIFDSDCKNRYQTIRFLSWIYTIIYFYLFPIRQNINYTELDIQKNDYIVLRIDLIEKKRLVSGVDYFRSSLELHVDRKDDPDDYEHDNNSDYVY